jgi:asparagine N-glycosylation enzyme membrane subunit Stt3
VLAGFALGVLACFLPLLSYARAAGEIGRTSVLEFYEPLISLGNAAADLGVPLAIFGTLGTIALFRAPRRSETLFLAFWITTFFAAFVLLEYVYRFGAYVFEREFYTAFTPSRFLTDLAYPLSIAGGYALCELTQHLKRSVASFAVLAGALIWCGWVVAPQCVEADPKVDVAAFRWIATHAEPNALVLSESRWAPYLTWRESAYTPLPASEARNDERVRSKRRLLIEEPSTAADFSRTSRRPTYLVASVARKLPGTFEEVYRGERAAVYKVIP